MAEEEQAFKTDYAKSAKSCCTACKQPIPKDELRLGPMEQSQHFDGKIPRWHHMTCFEDRWIKRNPGVLKSLEQVGGSAMLKFEDQKRIKALCSSGSADNAVTKAESKEEKALEEESKKLHALKDLLRKHCKPAEVREILEHNHQPNTGKLFGGEENCLMRCADGMLFGALPKCSECDGDFIFTKGRFVCTGNVDEFTRCSIEKEDVPRSAWKIPSDVKEDNDWLEKWKFKKGKKLLFSMAHPSSQTPDTPAAGSKRKKDGKAEEPPPKVARSAAAAPAAGAGGAFGGVSVAMAGRTAMDKDEIKDMVTKHGGKFVARGNDFDYLVTSRKDAAGKAKRITDAIKAGKVLVTEGWLDSCVHSGSLISGDELGKFCLANQPTDAVKEDADKAAQRAERNKLADAAIMAAKRKEIEAALSQPPEEPTKSAKQKSQKIVTVKGGAAVEEDSGLVETGKIYSPKKSQWYSCTMNAADVATGKNSYYILQLIEHEDSFSVFRKWGKLGTPIGGKKLETFPLLSSARSWFEKYFLEKTGNTFDDYLGKRFQKKPGKFMVLEVDYEGGSGLSQQQQLQGYSGSLDDPTQKLMTLLFDIKEMEAALLQMEIDTQKMPLGKLSKSTLTNGLSALTDIQKILDQHPAGLDELAPEEQRRVKSRLAGLSNKFYTFIPHVFDKDAQPTVLNTREQVQAKNELVNALMEMEVATSLMQQQAQQGEHPIDANYAKLKCQFDSVGKDSSIFKMVDEYLQNTHAKTHNMYTLELEDLWAIDREGEEGRYAKFADDKNRQLLWHGSRITNWVGILSQGLRIAPPEAPATGYMFGKGVYFADMSSKSANYCFTSSEKTTGILLLSEVALGDMFENLRSNYIHKLPAGKLSCKGVGTTAPNPKGTRTLENGCVVPMGEGQKAKVDGSHLRYNEYIVYDVAQVRMRYLLRVNFNYKKKTGTFF
eukprot:Hpha_TRINITY_DN12715_c0_g2::TRINITY_DN12715_c0_g2_i1::g.114152::m.114152/K10798/PARP; poly [ADP-ribose] polymerase